MADKINPNVPVQLRAGATFNMIVVPMACGMPAKIMVDTDRGSKELDVQY